MLALNDKGYTPNWTEEVFTIDRIQYTNPITYTVTLKYLSNEEIKGSFYEPELLKAEQDIFRIDKVIRQDHKKKQALVKWKGYSDDFNSWILLKDLENVQIIIVMKKISFMRIHCPNPMSSHWFCFCCNIVIQRNSINKHFLSKNRKFNHYEYGLDMNRNNE